MTGELAKLAVLTAPEIGTLFIDTVSKRAASAVYGKTKQRVANDSSSLFDTLAVVVGSSLSSVTTSVAHAAGIAKLQAIFPPIVNQSLHDVNAVLISRQDYDLLQQIISAVSGRGNVTAAVTAWNAAH
jgi:hypothetical protein